MIKYENVCLMYSIKVSWYYNNCLSLHKKEEIVVPFRRRNLSQSDFSVKAVREGNTIPATIRELDAYESGKEMVNLGLSSVNILYTCWLSCYCFLKVSFTAIFVKASTPGGNRDWEFSGIHIIFLFLPRGRAFLDTWQKWYSYYF